MSQEYENKERGEEDVNEGGSRRKRKKKRSQTRGDGDGRVELWR